MTFDFFLAAIQKYFRTIGALGEHEYLGGQLGLELRTLYNGLRDGTIDRRNLDRGYQPMLDFADDEYLYSAEYFVNKKSISVKKAPKIKRNLPDWF
jgi:hypothetical protein